MTDFRKTLVLVLKIAGSLLIIGVLLYLAVNTPEKRETLREMWKKQWAWPLLAMGFAALFAAILITMVRWWYLVRAVGIDLALPDAIRIGFIGYLFNLMPMGIVGGNLLKAWMLAKENPGNRAKALASVVVDRIVGLYVLFLVAVAGILITGFWSNSHLVCIAVIGITLVSTVGIVLVLIPGFLEWMDGVFARAEKRAPKVGHAIRSLLDAIKVYRGERAVLFWTAVATVPVHTFLTISIYFLAMGMGFQKVPFRDYFAVYPVSSILSTIPLPAGPQETGIVFLYRKVDIKAGAPPERAQQEGTILALVYRLSTILIAPIGAAYYFLGSRAEVSEVMQHHDGNGDADAPV